MNNIQSLLKSVKKNSKALMLLSDNSKKELLNDLANLIEANVDQIKTANQKDLLRMDDADPKKDRLLLTNDRIQASTFERKFFFLRQYILQNKISSSI